MKSYITRIGRFRGIDLRNNGENLDMAYSPDMVNFRIGSDGTLIKREGYVKVCPENGIGRGMAYFDEFQRHFFLFASGSTLYKYENGTKTTLGTLNSSTGNVSFLDFQNKIYIFDGSEIKIYDGTNFSALLPYVPLTVIGSPVSGGGTAYEATNLLTPKMRVRFSPEGDFHSLKLPLQNIASVEYVKLLYTGLVIPDSKYSVNPANGTITFDKTYSTEVPDGVEVCFSVTQNDSAKIHSMRYAVPYGKGSDYAVFLYGSDSEPCAVRFSSQHDGLASVDYFPEYNVTLAGTSPVTSVIRQHERLLVFTEKEAFYMTSELKLDETGKNYFSYPINTISANVGNKSLSFVKLIDNCPLVVNESGLYKFVSTTIRDEKNSVLISERINRELLKLNMSSLKSFDDEIRGELYLYESDKIFVYNYRENIFWYYEGISASGFCRVAGDIWFLSTDGSLCKMSENIDDNGEPITAKWVSPYIDGVNKRKNIQSVDVGIMPHHNSRYELIFESDKDSRRSILKNVPYRKWSFADLDFSSVGFNTSMSVRIYKNRIMAKRCRFYKLILICEGEKTNLHVSEIMVSGSVVDKD